MIPLIEDKMIVAVDLALQYPQEFAHEIAKILRPGETPGDNETVRKLMRYGPYSVGDTVFIRAIPFHYTGTITYIDGEMICLNPCSFVRSTGQWTEALQTGEIESRIFPANTVPVVVTRHTINNCFRWPHPVR